MAVEWLDGDKLIQGTADILERELRPHHRHLGREQLDDDLVESHGRRDNLVDGRAEVPRIHVGRAGILAGWLGSVAGDRYP